MSDLLNSFEQIQQDIQFENAKDLFLRHGLAGLSDIVRNGEQLDNKELRLFIADAMEGKVKRRRGKQRETNRDWAIFEEISQLISGGMLLTSNANQDGAGYLVGQAFGIGEDAAIKSYQRKKEIKDEADRLNREVWGNEFFDGFGQ